MSDETMGDDVYQPDPGADSPRWGSGRTRDAATKVESMIPSLPLWVL